MQTDPLLYVLTGIAAVGGVTGVALLVYAWIDRPQTAWQVRSTRPQIREREYQNGHTVETIRPPRLTERHEVEFLLRPIGDTVVYDVQVRTPGAHHRGKDEDLFTVRLSSRSDPVRVPLVVPDRKHGYAYLEITWHQLRPHRHLAERMNLHTGGYEVWRWKWRSIRPRRGRLMRTAGRWVPTRHRHCPTVPVGLPSPTQRCFPRKQWRSSRGSRE